MCVCVCVVMLIAIVANRVLCRWSWNCLVLGCLLLWFVFVMFELVVDFRLTLPSTRVSHLGLEFCSRSRE